VIAEPTSKTWHARPPFRGRGSSIALGCLSACASIWSCTEFESPTDVQIATEFGSLDPAELSADWGCLEPGAEPPVIPVSAQSVAQVIYSVQVVDLSTGQIYPDARMRACGITDINCENPVTDWLTVDSQGWVHLPLFRDFVGFFEVMSPEIVPYIFYVKEPLTRSIVEYPLAVISLASLGPLLQLVGVQPQPGTGIVVLRTFDCTGKTATGVRLSSESGGTTWYFVDGLPSTMVSASSSDGLGGLVNVEPGLAVVDVDAPTGVSIGGPQSLVVRANWMSVVFLRPRAGARLAPQ
jgi:hypothetical protein